ncbi:sensor histidine kinase [Nonomuraea sp. SBT364]|uniref:sensor histidine kinase n=1 Tax=Nonomuraea sp. SBT364 TaxID=1580530 RepID=UPI00066BA1C1|nr:histidine kinase [Nonomuraea sp. SBT364]
MNESHPLFARRLARRQLIMLDLAAGLGLSFVFFTMTAAAAELPPWARIALPLGLGLPLAVRRLWPFPVFLLTLSIAMVTVVIDVVSVAYVAPAYAIYLVAVSENRGTWLPTSAIGVLAAITGAGLVLVGGVPQPGVPEWLLRSDTLMFGIAALGGAWTVGRAVRERRIYMTYDADRMAAQAVTEERLRIARELHDVVTHNVGLIAVKAGVANHVFASNPEEAQDALRVIESASRSALVEMRHLLGVLRSTGTPARAPAPGISGLDELADQARLSGVEVDLDVRVRSGDTDPHVPMPVGYRPSSVDRAGARGDVSALRSEGTVSESSDGRGERLAGGSGASSRAGHGGSGGRGHVTPGQRLPEGVELSVYRIVQEALTNVVKHAAPARCWVSVIDDGRAVRIEVRDDGPGPRTGQRANVGPGHGLIGMRERVTMYGGVFEAGGLPRRGFRVAARLPYGVAP